MHTTILDTEAGFQGQFSLCCTNIDDYVVPLELDAAKVAKLKTTGGFIKFIFGLQVLAQSYAHSITSYKDQLFIGPSKLLMGAVPLPPVYPAIMPAISMGNAKAQYADMIKDCIKSPNYTNDIGIKLGFIISEAAAKEEPVTPLLVTKPSVEGHPVLHAKKGIYQGYEVWKDCGDSKGYFKLDTSMYPDYTDLSDLPAIGTGKTWKYKVIYILAGVHSGNWSNEVTVGVFGQI